MKKIMTVISVILIALMFTGCGRRSATKSVRLDYIKENDGFTFKNYAIAIDDKKDNKNTYAVYKKIKSNKYQRLFRLDEEIKKDELLATDTYLYIIKDSNIIGYKLNSTINNVKKVEKEFDTSKDEWTIANVYGFKENYIYVSISGKEDGKESTKFVRLKNDLSATDVLESESLVPTDLTNNINLEK